MTAAPPKRRGRATRQPPLAVYLQRVVAEVRDLRLAVDRRRNTLKIRAMDSVLSILRARATASLTLAQNGVELAPIGIQQGIYQPVLDWFRRQLGEPED